MRLLSTTFAGVSGAASFALKRATCLRAGGSGPLSSLIIRNHNNAFARYRRRLDRLHCGPLKQRRTLFIDGLPTWLVPPAVFAGLFVTLWIYKCIMMVAVQNKIIYMPYLPPFTRSEKIDDYAKTCQPVQWTQTHIRSLDGTKLALCTGRIPQTQTHKGIATHQTRHVVICYFHGNGGSLPPRLPMLSNILKAIQAQHSGGNFEYSLVALSYRGYWTSSGKASQPGIEKDAQALLRWVNTAYASAGTGVQLVLWGQSLGAGVATTAAASYIRSEKCAYQAPITRLVLETPFTGIKGMLLALYPQKWLPYRYLWPFLRSHWDSEGALRGIATAGFRPQTLIVSAEKDEVVPSSEPDKLQRISREAGLPTERRDIRGALHTEATTRHEGRQAVAKFIAGKRKRDRIYYTSRNDSHHSVVL